MLPALIASVLVANLPFDFELEDQFERKHRAVELFGRSPVLLVGGDQRRTDEQIRDWAEALRSRLGPDVHVVGLANLDGVPFFVPNKAVRNGLEETNPKTIVLCDWKGRVFAQLGFEPNTISVHVYDERGRRLLEVRGIASAERLETIAAALSKRSARRVDPKAQTSTQSHP